MKILMLEVFQVAWEADATLESWQNPNTVAYWHIKLRETEQMRFWKISFGVRPVRQGCLDDSGSRMGFWYGKRHDESSCNPSIPLISLLTSALLFAPDSALWSQIVIYVLLFLNSDEPCVRYPLVLKSSWNVQNMFLSLCYKWDNR